MGDDLGPFVKWCGGKRSLLDQLLPLVPEHITKYYEPMVGGGALFFSLIPRNFQKYVIGDENGLLMSAYRDIKDQPELVAGHLSELVTRHTENRQVTFAESRDELNTFLVYGSLIGSTRATALFLYTNMAGFNGLWRVSKTGKYNVPIGTSTDVSSSIAKMWAASKLLNSVDVEFIHGCYSKHQMKDLSGCFVYFDPPYVPISDTSNFTSFTPKGFGAEDHIKLSKHCAHLASLGAMVVVSNSAHQSVIDMYSKIPNAKIIQLEVNRSVGGGASSRKRVPEVVIVIEPV